MLKGRYMMKKAGINPLLLIGFIGIFTIGSQFAIRTYQAFAGPKNIWWTHTASHLPFEDSKNSFQVFIKGVSLHECLERGSLTFVDKNEEKIVIDKSDVSVRLNNWYKVKSTYLTFATLSGVTFGIVLALFAVGLSQYMRRRGPVS